MIGYFLLALSAHFRAGRSLYILTVLGVALGVASVLSIQIINRNALAAFEGSVQAVSGDADLSVMGRTPAFPEQLYAQVLSDPQVTAAWPLLRVDVALDGHVRTFLDIVGVDLFAPMHVPWQGDPGDVSEALGRPGWVAVGTSLAGQMGWVLGDSVAVTIGSRRVRLTIGALVDFQAILPAASPRLAVMDIAQAQHLFGRRGEIHQIDVKITEGVDPRDVMARLQDVLGPSVQVLTPEQRGRQAEGLLAAFRLNLTAMSLISLFVGVFLVYSSTQASLIRRRAEFGLLRSLGGTRGQVFRLILAEIALLGVVGVSIGLPMGYWAAQANVDMVSATLTNLYLLEGISTLEMPLWLYLLAAGVGIGGATAGALLPALELSRKDTRSLLAAFTLHERVGTLAPRLFLAGVIALLLDVGWFWAWGRHWQHAGFVLGIGLLVGIPLVTPYLAQQVCGLIRVRGFGFGYSLRSLGARLQTTSTAVASLAIAVSMLIGITLMIGSFRRTLEVWVGSSIQADVYITSPSWRGKGDEATLEPRIVSEMAAHSGVVAADRLRGFTAFSGERRVALAGVDMGLPEGEHRFPLLQGRPAEVLRQVRDEGAVLVGETLARKAGIWTGDSLDVYGPSGEMRFHVAGVYYDYSTEGGAVVMDLGTLERAFGPGGVNSMALYVAQGRNADVVVDELKARFPKASLLIRSNRRLREEIFRVFDQTFAITRLLQTMSLVIAVCGITLMLLVLARERVSELALYRAIGASRRQVFGIFVGKGLGMGLLGLGLGLFGGIGLAAVLILVINRAYFGWTIQIYWPWLPFTEQVVSILGAAVLASLYPAFRASRTPATELSRDDI